LCGEPHDRKKNQTGKAREVKTLSYMRRLIFQEYWKISTAFFYKTGKRFFEIKFYINILQK